MKVLQSLNVGIHILEYLKIIVVCLTMLLLISTLILPQEVFAQEDEYNNWGFLEHPFFLLIVGGIITGIFIPTYNRLNEAKLRRLEQLRQDAQIEIDRNREDLQNELKIKSEIVKKISKVSIEGIGRIYYLCNKDGTNKSLENTTLGTEEYFKWYTEREITTSLLSTYFRDSSVTTRWRTYVHTLAQLWSLFDVVVTDRACSEKDFSEIKEYFQGRTSINWDELREGKNVVDTFGILNNLLYDDKDDLMKGVIEEKISTVVHN